MMKINMHFLYILLVLFVNSSLDAGEPRGTRKRSDSIAVSSEVYSIQSPYALRYTSAGLQRDRATIAFPRRTREESVSALQDLQEHIQEVNAKLAAIAAQQESEEEQEAVRAYEDDDDTRAYEELYKSTHGMSSAEDFDSCTENE
jgi:hypothetical protein